jgi:hypothetical protein
MQIKNFEDLEIWKESRRLTRDVYDLSKAPKFFKDFGLGDQMRRAAVSIMSNIAKDSSVAAIKSSSNTSTLQGLVRRDPFATLRGTRSKISGAK